MPRVSFSNDYLLGTLSPNEIDEILSRKLYNQLKTEENEQKSQSFASPSLTPLFNPSAIGFIDSDIIALIDQFFNLTYLNTIPMVNLLATAVATNFLKENIRELDKKLQEQQATQISIKRGSSLLYETENDDDDDDDNLSWTSAPT